MKLRLQAFLIITLISLSLIPRSGGSAQTSPAWDGQIIYIGEDGNLWLLRSDAPEPFQITNDASEQIRYNSPLFAPNGELLGYCRNESGGQGASQIFIMRPDAWQPIEVVDDVYCQHWPQGSFTWSPDGKQIAYARMFEYAPQPDGSQWSSYHGIWMVDISSGESNELVPPPGKNPLVLPSWSPDGKWLRMYESIYLEGLGVMRTWERETGALYNWLEMGADLFPGFADWSPDSARLVFDEVTYLGYPDAGLFTAAPAGGDLKPAFTNADQAALHPLWSPDGRNLAFLLYTYGASPQNVIAVSAPDGSNLVWVFSSPANLEVLDWSPNGRQVLFSSTESGEGGEKTGLYIYDLDSASHFTAAYPGGKQADWAPVYVEDKTIPGGKPGVIPDFQTQGSPIAYLANNYQLMLYDPASQAQAALTPPLVVKQYWASPSGTRLVYSDQLLSLKVGADGTVALTQVGLPATPGGESVSWSPDETRLGFRDGLDRVWMVQMGGDYVEIPGATSLPSWSYDGRFLSYCTDGDRLWSVGGGISLRQVAAGVECRGDTAPQWSSSLPWLAYTQVVSGTQNSLVYVYDAEKGESNPVMADVSLTGWSPDGKLLALRQAESAQATTFTDFAVEPQRTKSLEVGEIDLSLPGNTGWSEASEGYLLGAYQFDERLRKSERVAETLYDTTLQGSILLIGTATDGIEEILCLDVAGGEPRSLLSANLSGIPTDEKPGLWAWLAPDGVWSAAYGYDAGSYRYFLTRCDRTRQIALESTLTPENDSFSPDGQWFLQIPIIGGQASQLLVYHLESLERQSLALLPTSKAVWVQSPQISLQPSDGLTGSILDAQGNALADVTILVDGEPAASSDANGSYTLSGLSDGEHSLSVEKEGFQFTPETIDFSIPYEGEAIVFTADTVVEAGIEPTAAAPEADATQAEQESQPSAPAAGETPAAPQAAPGPAALSTNTLGMILGGLLIVLLLAALFARILRRKRQGEAPAVDDGSPAEPIPTAPPLHPEEPVAAQPAAASKSGARTEADRLLREGVAQVKAGQNAAGLEKLRKVIQIYPENAVAWLWSGMAATRLKDWRTAEQCFVRAKELDHPKADEALKWLDEQRKQH
jgi:Tol biopolymer transport system component